MNWIQCNCLALCSTTELATHDGLTVAPGSLLCAKHLRRLLIACMDVLTASVCYQVEFRCYVKQLCKVRVLSFHTNIHRVLCLSIYVSRTIMHCVARCGFVCTLFFSHSHGSWFVNCLGHVLMQIHSRLLICDGQVLGIPKRDLPDSSRCDH